MGYSVDPEKLMQIGQLLRTTAENIQETITQLKSQVDGLDSDWQGAARQQFDELFFQWHHTNQQNANSLIDYAQNVARAAQNYQDTENLSKDLLSGF